MKTRDFLNSKKSSGGGYRLSKILNKDIKELNGIILSLFCVSFLITVGLISYKVNSSYAIFTDTIEGEKTLEFSVGFPQDKSGANAPVLSENMIPVYYDETCNSNAGCWKKADSENMSSEYKWYDYDSKMWANSVTVSTNDEGVRTDLIDAPEGTEIPMDRILTMQVWIPKYTYTIWNYNADGTATSEPQEIDIQFESGTATTGEISCVDNIQGTSDGTSSGTEPTTSETCIIKSTNATCTDTCNGKTYTHPAFTFGDKELTGFWVGKFEVSSDISCEPANSSAIGAGCNLTSIRPLVKPNVTSWRGAMVGTFENNIMAMNDASNKYGFEASDDTHMMKNMEWGAVVYLSHSKYGTCADGMCTEVALNSASTYTTGCGPQSEGSTSSGTICNTYNTTLGQSASTTGNVYGVYDMSGGASDYVMGNMVSPDGITMMSGNREILETSVDSHSGYSGILYYLGLTSNGYVSSVGAYEYPENKYYDKYSFNTSSTTRGRSKLGDARKEVYNISNYGWYSDYSRFAYGFYPWFNRGGYYNELNRTGVFNSGSMSGDAHIFYSSRLVISQ